MTALVRTATAVIMLGLGSVWPNWAWGGCAEDIAALEKQVEVKGRQAVAATTGGQADAAARGSQTEAVKKSGPGAKTVPAPDGSEVTETTAKAASGGEGAVKAKVILNDAREALDRGNETECHQHMLRARDQLKG